MSSIVLSLAVPGDGLVRPIEPSPMRFKGGSQRRRAPSSSSSRRERSANSTVTNGEVVADPCRDLRLRDRRRNRIARRGRLEDRSDRAPEGGASARPVDVVQNDAGLERRGGRARARLSNVDHRLHVVADDGPDDCSPLVVCPTSCGGPALTATSPRWWLTLPGLTVFRSPSIWMSPASNSWPADSVICYLRDFVIAGSNPCWDIDKVKM